MKYRIYGIGAETTPAGVPVVTLRAAKSFRPWSAA